MVKHLIYNPETLMNELLIQRLKEKAGEIEPLIKIVLTLKAFKKVLPTILWDTVTINFGSLQFAHWDSGALIGFVDYIRKNQNKHFTLVGITGYKTQKEILEKHGVSILGKELSEIEIDFAILSIERPFIRKNLSVKEIRVFVSDYFNVPNEKMSEKTRKREVVQARQVSMYFSKMFTRHSLKEIGEDFGGRDHTTVIHSCQTVKDLMDSDSFFKDKILELQDIIASGGGHHLMAV